ncbi:hypothetical protein F5Y08DRAFT_293707 [Xylaria arbuscula]|nr:hypothetical protein F5Y08DRAFT_293707 [Xylaria arbuscula]
MAKWGIAYGVLSKIMLAETQADQVPCRANGGKVLVVWSVVEMNRAWCKVPAAGRSLRPELQPARVHHRGGICSHLRALSRQLVRSKPRHALLRSSSLQLGKVNRLVSNLGLVQLWCTRCRSVSATRSGPPRNQWSGLGIMREIRP